MAATGAILLKLGGEAQLRIETPDDLARMHEIPEALWVATSAPLEGLNADAAFLRYIDSDGNGRIRTDELKTAQTWLFRMLVDRNDLATQTEVLRVNAIDVQHPEGLALHATAKRILANLDKPESATIALAEVRDRQRIVSSGACNGDGVIPPAAVEDGETGGLIQAIMQTIGSTADANGQPGVTETHLDQFLAEGRAYLAWHAEGQVPEGKKKSPVMVWGQATPEAYDCLAALRDKIDEYFRLCRLVRFDERAMPHLVLSEEDLAAVDPADRESVEGIMRRAPLAPPTADETLHLHADINPMYAEALERFATTVLHRFKDKKNGSVLSLEDWTALKALFAPYATWIAGKRGEAVEALGHETLQRFVDSPAVETLRALIAADRAVAAELAEITNLEKLILYQQWLLELANNFIACPRFYDPARRSMIESGTLVMDGRVFDLNVRVADPKAHRTVAEKSNICILYLDLVRKADASETMMRVATAVTAGGSRRFFIGKAGVFFTPDGTEWDARVTDMLLNPVSLWEAVRAPFQRLGEFVGTQIEKFSSSRYADLEKGVGQTVTQAEQSIATPAGGTPPAARSASPLQGIMLSGSVAVAALGSAFAFITKSLASPSVNIWSVLSVLGGLVLLLALPPIVLATIKLRRRDLGLFLEASGWAINARMRLSRRMGLLFTRFPDFPADASMLHADLTRDFLRALPRQKHPLRIWIAAALLAAGGGVLVGYLAQGPLRLGERIARIFVTPRPAPLRRPPRPSLQRIMPAPGVPVPRVPPAGSTDNAPPAPSRDDGAPAESTEPRATLDTVREESVPPVVPAAPDAISLPPKEETASEPTKQEGRASSSRPSIEIEQSEPPKPDPTFIGPPAP